MNDEPTPVARFLALIHVFTWPLAWLAVWIVLEYQGWLQPLKGPHILGVDCRTADALICAAPALLIAVWMCWWIGFLFTALWSGEDP